jgi:hypothetical protein
MNIKCSNTRVFSTNFYHFLAQQLQAIYYYKVENSLEKVRLFYDGPFSSIIKLIPFIELKDLKDAPDNCKIVEPIKDLKRIKGFGSYLKYIFITNIKVTEPKGIVIVQRNKKRVLTNIEELERKLKPLSDVGVVNLDTLPFLEQLTFLYNAKTIIMSHGAAMTYCLLLRNSTKIVELYPQYFNISYYANLAKSFGIPHIETENESFLSQCNDKDKEYLEKNKNSEGRFDKSLILSDHRLRSILRDVDYIKIDIDEVKKALTK